MTRKMDNISLVKIGKFDKREEVVIAIPKPNKMGNKIAWKLLEESTLMGRSKERGGLIPTSNPKYKVLEIPSTDIPLYVKGGVCDLGICGTDMVVETGMVDILAAERARKRDWNKRVAEAASFLYKLADIGKEIRFCVVAGADRAGEPVFWLNGRLVGTTFPNIAKGFLTNQGVRANYVMLGGSVEQAYLEGIIDAGTDQVETGNSLKKAGMGVIAEILKTQYCLWANKQAYGLKSALIDQFVTITAGVLSAKRDYILSGGDNGKLNSGKKLLKFNVPPKSKGTIDGAVEKGEIPCSKSPTESPLRAPGWFGYEVVVETSQLMTTLSTLKKTGAQDIVWKNLDGYVK